MAVRTEKIKLNKFGLKKVVGVRMTMGQYDRMEELSIKLLEQEQYHLQHADEMTPLDGILSEKENKQAMFSFIQDTFALTDDETATIFDSVDPAQFNEAFDYVTSRMRGLTDAEYNLAVEKEKRRLAEENEDPKADSVESAD